MQLLTLTGYDARRWEPKRVRHRRFTIRAAWREPHDGSDCTSRTAPPGPAWSAPPSPRSAPWPTPAEHRSTRPDDPAPPPAVEPAPPPETALGSTSHPDAAITP